VIGQIYEKLHFLIAVCVVTYDMVLTTCYPKPGRPKIKRRVNEQFWNALSDVHAWPAYPRLPQTQTYIYYRANRPRTSWSVYRSGFILPGAKAVLV
jgi:hypothetical protein